MYFTIDIDSEPSYNENITNGVLSSKRKGLKMKTVTLEVTQQDIDRAIAWKKKVNSPGMLSVSCPLARAGRRTFHNVSQAYPGGLCVYKHNNKPNQKCRKYSMDSFGYAIMNNFDAGRFNLLKPCVVTLTSVPR